MQETGLGPAARALGRVLARGTLLNALPVGVYCCDLEGLIWHFNDRAAELWGRSPKIGEPDERYCGSHKLFRPDGTYLPHDQTPMVDVLRTGEPVRDARVVVERPDGRRLLLLVNIDPLFDEDGALVGAVNCFQDISEQARAYEELQRSRDDLEDFFQNGAVGLHVVGSDGIILRANQAELDMLGYTEAEYVGRRIADFHLDEPVIADILGRLARGEKLDRCPARLRAKDGSVREVLITSNAHFRDGEFISTRCFTLDVTEAKLAEKRAREGEQRFQDVLEGLPAPVYTTDAEGRITFYNRAAAELAGREPRIGEDKWCVLWRLYHADGTPLPHDECPMAIALREKRPVEGSELIAERPDGSRVRCMPHPTLLYDGEGRLTGAVNMLIDVTERHEAELQSAHLAAIVSSSSDAIVSKTLEGTIQSWNAGATKIFGYEASEMIGQPILRIIPPELHDEEREILSRLRRGERVEHFETERLTKDGRRLNISLTISPIHDRFGRVVGASKAARDITERKRAEELQRLLISELNHRVKNTLATVQSIANQTVRYAKSPREFAMSFSGRIQALANTHDLLTRNSWQGADILALVRDQLLLNGDEDERISFSGPSLTLETQPALHLALVLHELGTNARKYGSLSVPGGRLSVSWSVETKADRRLLLHWKESGGPSVKVPASRGFGTTLIERSLAAHGGEVSIQYRASGVSCDVSLPVSDQMPSAGAFARQAHTTASAASVGASVRQSAVQGKRVLVVEDEALISLDVVTTLSEAGCIVAGPAATVESARELIETGEFDVALLDANLGGSPVGELAAALTRMNVPFGFMTGYGREGLPEPFRQAPMINKPFTGEDALDLVARLAGSSEKVVSIRRKDTRAN